MGKAKAKVETEVEAEKAESKQPTFGERLRAVRREHGLTRKQIAEVLGCQDSAIEYFEADAVQPTADALAVIGKQFGVDLHLLLTCEEAPQLAKEITAVRSVKKQFRQILNEVRVRTTELEKLDKVINGCIETIAVGLNPPKAPQKDTQDSNARQGKTD